MAFIVAASIPSLMGRAIERMQQIGAGPAEDADRRGAVM
jgi:hypothetical protein